MLKTRATSLVLLSLFFSCLFAPMLSLPALLPKTFFFWLPVSSTGLVSILVLCPGFLRPKCKILLPLSWFDSILEPCTIDVFFGGNDPIAWKYECQRRLFHLMRMIRSGECITQKVKIRNSLVTSPGSKKIARYVTSVSNCSNFTSVSLLPMLVQSPAVLSALILRLGIFQSFLVKQL